MCEDCARLRGRYAAATDKREWAKSDLIAAFSSQDGEAIRAAQMVKEQAVREWECALAELDAHLNVHGH